MFYKTTFKVLALLTCLALISFLMPRPVLGESAFTVLDRALSLVGGDNVRAIPTGSVIYHFGDGTTEVRSADNTVILRAKGSEAKILKLPKEEVSATKVCEVPSGSYLRKEDDGRVNIYKDGMLLATVMDSKSMDPKYFAFHDNEDRVEASTLDVSMVVRAVLSHFSSRPPEGSKSPPPQSYPYLDYWYGPHIEDAYDTDIDGIGYFRAQWDVPSSPPSPLSQTLDYVWNGLEPEDESDVLQPVIRYTQSDGWKGIAYYGIDGYYYPSSAISASPGDEIWGTIWYDSGNQNWRVTVYNWDTYSSTYITTNNFYASQNALIYLDLESRDGVANGDQLPGDIYFTGMQVLDTSSQAIDFDWTGEVRWAGPEGLGVTVFSDTSVAFYTPN